jgi:hypothetical protein
MKHIKDITISIFAIIGFAFVLSSFTSNETTETQEVVYGTPESHVWSYGSDGEDSYLFNKVTGVARILGGAPPNKKGRYITLSAE